MRIKGFTILELMVAMLLVSMVVAICWRIMVTLSTYHSTLTRNSRVALELLQMELAMERHFSTCSSYDITEGVLTLYGISDTTEFHFDSSLSAFTKTSIGMIFPGQVKYVASKDGFIHVKCVLAEENHSFTLLRSEPGTSHFQTAQK